MNKSSGLFDISVPVRMRRPTASLAAAFTFFDLCASGLLSVLDSSHASTVFLPRRTLDMRPLSSSFNDWKASTLTMYTIGPGEERKASNASRDFFVALLSQARTVAAMHRCFGISSSAQVDTRLFGATMRRASENPIVDRMAQVSSVVLVFPVPISMKRAWNPHSVRFLTASSTARRWCSYGSNFGLIFEYAPSLLAGATMTGALGASPMVTVSITPRRT